MPSNRSNGRYNRNQDPKRYAYTKRAAALRRQSEANQEPCWICQQPIDYTAPPRTPKAFTADHITPLSRGGDILGEIRAACWSCNARRGNGDRGTKGNYRRPTSVPKPITTRDW